MWFVFVFCKLIDISIFLYIFKKYHNAECQLCLMLFVTTSFSLVKSIFRMKKRLSSKFTLEIKIYTKNIVLFDSLSVLSNGSSNLFCHPRKAYHRKNFVRLVLLLETLKKMYVKLSYIFSYAKFLFDVLMIHPFWLTFLQTKIVTWW